jgi:hypothetical protein
MAISSETTTAEPAEPGITTSVSDDSLDPRNSDSFKLTATD